MAQNFFSDDSQDSSSQRATSAEMGTDDHTGSSPVPRETNRTELSVVMPCLNEAETLAICINKVWKWARENNVNTEIVIADNGSTDGSAEIAEKCGARVVYVAEKGYGSALSGGINAAVGRYVIMGDADDSYDFHNLTPFLEKLRQGYDLVMGNRFRGGIKKGAMPPLHRYLGNPVLTAIGRLFFHSPCRDFHCGLRGFNRESILSLQLRTTGMEFASEMVIKATLLGLKITEVPTSLSPDGRTRAPHLRSWRDGWRHLRFMLLYSPRWLFLYPGLFLILAGLLTGAILLAGPVRIGIITFDAQTLLLSATAIIIGYQAVLFSLFSRIFAFNEGLLPPHPRLKSLPGFIRLETGILFSLILVFAGLSGAVYSLVFWGKTSGFGNLDPSTTLRIVVPSVTAVIIGFQSLLASFFLSLLGIKRKNMPPDTFS